MAELCVDVGELCVDVGWPVVVVAVSTVVQL